MGPLKSQPWAAGASLGSHSRWGRGRDVKDWNWDGVRWRGLWSVDWSKSALSEELQILI